MKKNLTRLFIASFIVIASIFIYSKIDTAAPNLALLNAEAIGSGENPHGMSGPSMDAECGAYNTETNERCGVPIVWCEASDKESYCTLMLCKQHQTHTKK